jgi:hypothetical protein
VLSQSASLHSLSTNSMSEEARKLEELAEATPVSSDLPPIICFPGWWLNFGLAGFLKSDAELGLALFNEHCQLRVFEIKSGQLKDFCIGIREFLLAERLLFWPHPFVECSPS